MTEDTSPENLRKFLESEDPAMNLMGLSMAKTESISDSLLPTILDLYLWSKDKVIRTKARLIFAKHAPKKLQTNIKKKWMSRYRTMKNFTSLQEKLYSLFTYDKDLIHTEGLNRMLAGKNPNLREWAVKKLGILCGERAVESLIETFEADIRTWYRNDKFKLKINKDWPFQKTGEVIKNRRILQQKIVNTLGKIGGERATEALVVVSLYGRNVTIRDEAKKSLKRLNYKERNLRQKWKDKNRIKAAKEDVLQPYSRDYEYLDNDTRLILMIAEEKIVDIIFYGK